MWNSFFSFNCSRIFCIPTGVISLTLPVSVKTHVIVKIITVILWEIIILAVISLSWGIVFTGVPEFTEELLVILKPLMISN